MYKKINSLISLMWGLLASFALGILSSSDVMAFSKFTNGFKTMTSSYLVPLSGAVAGASFILFVIFSYFKQEEYQKKVGNVIIMAILSGAGLEMLENIIQEFS